MSNGDKLTAQEVLRQIDSTKKVTAEDVKILSDKVNANWKIGLGEAEILFKINKSVDEACPEWTEFFASSISRLIVMDMNTPGEINDSEGDWLADMFEAHAADNSTQKRLVEELRNMAGKIGGRIGGQIQPH